MSSAPVASSAAQDAPVSKAAAAAPVQNVGEQNIVSPREYLEVRTGQHTWHWGHSIAFVSRVLSVE